MDCPLVLRQRRIRHFSLNRRGVMEKKSERMYRQYPVGFQKDALERMKHCDDIRALADRKSTRLNSSHRCISYAVFCLKKNRPSFPAWPILAPPFGIRSASLALPTSRPNRPCADFCPAVKPLFFFFLSIGDPPKSTFFPHRRFSR